MPLLLDTTYHVWPKITSLFFQKFFQARKKSNFWRNAQISGRCAVKLTGFLRRRANAAENRNKMSLLYNP